MKLDRTLAALADPTRRAILARLTKGDATVADLARPFPISQPAVSRHLKVLEEAGLIESVVRGQTRPRRLKPEALRDAAGWFDDFRALWETRFDQLDTILEEGET